MIDLVEDIIDSIPLEGETPNTIIADNSGLAVSAIAPDVNNFQGLSFNVELNVDGSIKTAEPTTSTSSDATTTISIPQTILDDLGLDAADRQDLRVGFSVFQDDSLFQPRSTRQQPPGTEPGPRSAIGSSVISAQLSIEIQVSNLQTPIIVELSVKPV